MPWGYPSIVDCCVVFFSFAGWQAAMGVHLPNLCYYTVAVLGVVFCGGYTTLDTVTGLFLSASLWPS